MAEAHAEVKIDSKTGAQKNEDLEQMDKQELLAERARLQRSKGNNPQEEPWSETLFARLQRVEEKLQEQNYLGDQNKDLELMTPEKLVAEISELERSKGGNENAAPWQNSWQQRLDKAYSLKKIIAPNL